MKLAVHRHDERLEDARGVDAELLGRLEPIRLRRGIVRVLVQ